MLAEQLAPLRHQAQSVLDPFLDIMAPHVLALEEHAAARRQKAHDRAEKRGLSGAVRADHGDDLTDFERDGDAAHGLDLAIGDVEILGLQQRRHATPPR